MAKPRKQTLEHKIIRNLDNSKREALNKKEGNLKLKEKREKINNEIKE